MIDLLLEKLMGYFSIKLIELAHTKANNNIAKTFMFTK